MCLKVSFFFTVTYYLVLIIFLVILKKFISVFSFNPKITFEYIYLTAFFSSIGGIFINAMFIDILDASFAFN